MIHAGTRRLRRNDPQYLYCSWRHIDVAFITEERLSTYLSRDARLGLMSDVLPNRTTLLALTLSEDSISTASPPQVSGSSFQPQASPGQPQALCARQRSQHRISPEPTL